MATIREINVDGAFRYLWLKHVTGVDLSVHCARCLLGEYDNRISDDTRHASGLVLPSAPFHYLCGVSSPYVWARNFHLAFREKEGYIVEVARHGIRIVIEDAEEVPFGETDIDPLDPHAHLKAYRTCRNWQFAHKVKNNLGYML